MKHILIICGAEKTGYSDGRYNRSLAEAAERYLSERFQVRHTHIATEYDTGIEQEKFNWADVVIYQFPVFWFNCPSTLKRYIDQVFAHGVFFKRAQPYGSGGLMIGKQYLLSTTWNAPEEAFNDPDTFYQGASIDEALIAMHRANQYVGMKPLPSFAVFDVIKNPDYDANEARWIAHLQQLFGTKTRS